MGERVLDLLPDAVVVVDAVGEVVDLNDRCPVVLGVGPEAVGRSLDDVLELRDATGRSISLPPAPRRIADRCAEQLVWVVDPTGRPRPLTITGRWSDAAWTLVARGAGGREALERVRGDLVATVSHEIRSPLASVKGFTRTLLGRWERFSDEQKLTMLATIDHDADRVTRLLSDLLEVSRIDAGRVSLARAPGDLGVLCARVVDKARHRAAGERREFAVRVAPGTPHVLMDADRIEQVVTNLVDNALEHGRAGRILVEIGPDADGARVSVSDDGPGVGEDLREAIFRKFGRGRSERRSGTGLGLYIGRGLAEAHGGRLWLDPDATPGARFHLWLPAVPSGVETGVYPAAPA